MPKAPAVIKRAVSSKKEMVARIRKVLLTKQGVVISIVVMVVIGSLSVGAMIHQRNQVNQQANTASGIVENLEYQTILPEGKSISQLGGWKRVSPADKISVFAYVDSLAGVVISISEQPLPDTAKGTANDLVADIAKKFNATTKLDASGTVAYLGTSAKGPQSIIFSRNGLLILIKSQKQIDSEVWVGYIKSLQ